jgi:hypothetical protein
LIVRVEARVIVCGALKTAGSNTTVSGPAAAFASTIACRKLPGPLSAVFVTVNVAAEAPSAVAQATRSAAICLQRR